MSEPHALSPTQRHLDEETLGLAARTAFGAGTSVRRHAALTGGGFASVSRVELGDGRTVVLKVGPAPQTPLLAYERGLIGAEARYLRLAGPHALAGSLLPQLLATGSVAGSGAQARFDGEWLFMSLIPGSSLAALPEGTPKHATAAVRSSLGAAVARLHTITAPTGRFGYDGGRASGTDWPTAFRAMLASLLADAVVWDVSLPVPAPRLLELVERHERDLAAVERPALVHFDLWDGNVMCTPGAGAGGGLALSGLVDGERFLYGDPLVDFVSPALFRRVEDEPDHPFVVGYGRARGFTASEVRRLVLYRMYLYLLMVVEMPSRGMTGPRFADRSTNLRTLLTDAAAQAGAE